MTPSLRLGTALAFTLVASLTHAEEPLAAGRPGPKRVLVLEFTAIGADPSLAAPLPEEVAGRIGEHAGYSVVSRNDVNRLLNAEDTRHKFNCSEDEACLTEIGRRLDADLVVNGSIGQVGTSFLLTLTVTDPKNPAGGRRASVTVQTAGELPAAVPGVVDKIFDWQGGQGAGPATVFHLPAGKKLAFAVFDLKPSGISPTVAQNLTQVLSVEVKGVQGASVVSHDDILEMLKLQSLKMQVGCDDDGCMTEIAGALGVDRLITGDAGKVGTTYLVNLRLLDVRLGTVENRVSERFEGDEEQLLHAVRHAARSLLGLPDAGTGGLAVTASQNKADVFVDDAARGRAPVRLDAIATGRHALRVSQPGFFDYHGDVYVDPLETTVAWAQLQERPERWYQKWWVWTIAGVVVAGGTAVGIHYGLPPSKFDTGAVKLP